MSVCGLCEKQSQDVRFNFLVDVKDKDVSEWTFNIISLKRAKKLCTRCCQNLGLVGELLFKWKNAIEISLEAVICPEKTVETKVFARVQEDSPVAPKPTHDNRPTTPDFDTVDTNGDDVPDDSLDDFDEPDTTAADDDDFDSDESFEPPKKTAKKVKTTPTGKRGRPRKSENSSPPKKEPAKTKKTEPTSESAVCPDCGGSCKSKCTKSFPPPPKLPKVVLPPTKTQKTTAEAKSKSESTLCPRCGGLCKSQCIAPKAREKVVHRCSECPMELPTLKLLDRHQWQMHEVSRYVCRFCNKMFARPNRLAEHERIHTNEKPFVCKYCGMSFRRQECYNKHQLTHAPPVLDYKCSYCESRFKMPYQRDDHERGFHKTVQIACPFHCGEIFYRASHVIKHREECPRNSKRSQPLS